MNTDNVCITAPGTYTVELANSATESLAPTLNSLTIGGAATSGSQTLEILGQDPDNIFATGVSLAATTATIKASGIVQLAAADSSAISAFGFGDTTNAGEIVTQPRLGQYTLNGTILNKGTISIQGSTVLRESSLSTIINKKTITIGSGAQLSSTPNGSPEFVNDGTLSIASGGSMIYSGEEFIASGHITGTAPVVDQVMFPGTGSGPLSLSQIQPGIQPSFSGSLARGQTLTIDAAQSDWASTSGTNAGTIILSSATTDGSDLELGGTLLNTGTISLDPGSGGPRQISGLGLPCAIDNQGTVNIGTQDLQLGCDLTQETGSRIALTVSSAPSGGDFGSITSSGSSTLAGNLKVTTTLSTLPPGATYPIMSFNALTSPDTFKTYTYIGPRFHSANYNFNVGTVTLVAP